MKAIYDPEADAAYFYLVPDIARGGVAKTYVCDSAKIGGSINLDFDIEGRLLGIEVLEAGRRLPKELLLNIMKEKPLKGIFRSNI